MPAQEKTKKTVVSGKDILKIVFSAILTAGLLIILIKNISIKDTAELIRNLDFKFAAFSVIPYFICYLFRATRFRFFLADKTITIKKLTVIHTIHNMCNQLFPANLGEFVYLYLLKKNANIRLAESTSSLILARISDFGVIMVLFLISCFFLREKVFLKIKVYVYATVFALILLVLFYFFLIRLGKSAFSAKKHTGFFGKMINKIKYVLSELTCAMRKTHSFKRVTGGLLFSALAMNSLYVFYWIVMESAGVKVTYFEIIFLSSILVPIILLPIKGIAGFGTQEAGWAVGFLILGFSKHTAILTGFAIHIATLIFTIIFGLCGIAVLKIFFGNKVYSENH